MRPYPYLIVLTEAGREHLTPAAGYNRNGDTLTVMMPDRHRAARPLASIHS